MLSGLIEMAKSEVVLSQKRTTVTRNGDVVSIHFHVGDMYEAVIFHEALEERLRNAKDGSVQIVPRY